MREDMKKVLIDCYRGGRRQARKGRYKERADRPDENAIKYESMTAGGRSKWLCDRLGPLRRYLDKQVGRPWDKVWSEIAKNVPADGVMQIHVRSHVWDFVQDKVVEIDGKLFAQDWHGIEPLRTSWFTQFYVCPKTGLLRRIPSKGRRRGSYDREPNPHPNRIRLECGRQVEKIDGVWFEIVVTEGPRPRPDAAPGIIEKKRTLSKKEIKKLVPEKFRTVPKKPVHLSR